MLRGRYAGIAVLLVVSGGLARAQEADTAATAPLEVSLAADDAITDDDLLSDEELDALVAPIALYPDALLAQILVAATYPLEVVKADRFIAANATLDDKARATAAEGEDWDPSVQVLTGGFPAVLTRMAEEVDWTEDLGDAMLAQSDDLFDAIQRQRSRAAALGNLESNAAQTVAEEEGKISVAPAEEDKVYVPQYDAATAYTTPYTAPPVIATADTGYSTASLVTTGAIAFGSALLIDNLFDDDDDDDWDNYWRPGSSNIDWDEGDIRARPNVDIEGDVNINRRPGGGNRIDIDNDRIGNGDRNGAWKPSDADRDAAKRRLAEREGGKSSAAARDKARKNATAGDARAKLEAAGAKGEAPAKRAEAAGGGKKAAGGAAFSGLDRDGGKSAKASERGKQSLTKAKRPEANAKAKQISKPQKIKPPVAKPGKKSSAFKQSGGGSHKAKKSAQRGKKQLGRR